MLKRRFKLAMLLICVGLFVLLIVKTGPAVIASRVYEVGAVFLYAPGQLLAETNIGESDHCQGSAEPQSIEFITIPTDRKPNGE